MTEGDGRCVLSGLLADVDEIARGLTLAGAVGLEVSVDAVLHAAMEGLVQETREALQAVGVVGQTEFTGGTHTHTQIRNPLALNY